MTEDWTTTYVFVSSTFEDMQAERDALRVAFDDLAERLSEHRRFLVPIDLRWGVTSREQVETVDKELHILKVCLEEIRRSQPYFIGLVGDRYGWIPDPARMVRAVEDSDLDLDVEGKSVTALEFEYGVFALPAQQRRSRFFLRDPLPYHEMPPEVVRRYREDGTEARLEALRQRIQDQMPDRWDPYTLGWDRRLRAVTGLEDFAALVAARLEADIVGQADREDDDDLRSAGAAPTDPAVVELDRFFTTRRQVFVGRDQTVEMLTHRALVPEPADLDASWRWWWPQRGVRTDAPGALLLGEAGEGKSAVLAAVADRVAADPRTLLLAHSAGAGPRSASIAGLLERWTAALLEAGSPSGRDPAPTAGPRTGMSPGTARADFIEALGRVAAERPVVLLIDALDQFEPGPEGEYLTFLPDPLPRNVRLVASARPSTIAARATARADVDGLWMPPLDRSDLRRIVVQLAARHRRTLDDEVVDALFDGRSAPTPLWARLAVDALLLLDEDDFDRSRRFDGTAEDRLHALLRSTAAAYPDGAPAMYERQYDLAARRYGELATTSLALLATSQGGLRDTDLAALLPALGVHWDQLTFAHFRRSLREVFTRRNDERLDFLHLQGRTSALLHLPEAGSLMLHRAIADHLASLGADDPVRDSDLVVHLLAADDGPGVLTALVGGSHPAAVRAVVNGLRVDASATVRTLERGLADDQPLRQRVARGRALLDDVVPAVRLGGDHTALGHLVTRIRAAGAAAAAAQPQVTLTEPGMNDTDLVTRGADLHDDALVEATRIAVESGADQHETGWLARQALERLIARTDAGDGAIRRAALFRLVGRAAERDGDVEHAFERYLEAEEALRPPQSEGVGSVGAHRCDVLLDLAATGTDCLDADRVAVARSSLDQAAESDTVDTDLLAQSRLLRLRAERLRRQGNGREAGAAATNASVAATEAARRDPGDRSASEEAARAALAEMELALEAGVHDADAALELATRHLANLPPPETSRTVRDLGYQRQRLRAEAALAGDDDRDALGALRACLDGPESSATSPDAREATTFGLGALRTRVLDGMEHAERGLRMTGLLLLMGGGSVMFMAGVTALFLLLSATVLGLADEALAGQWFDEALAGSASDPADVTSSLASFLDGVLSAMTMLLIVVVLVTAASVVVVSVGSTRGVTRAIRWAGVGATTHDGPRRVVIAIGAFAIALVLAFGLCGGALYAAEGAVAGRWEAYRPALSPELVLFATTISIIVVAAQTHLALRAARALTLVEPVTMEVPALERWYTSGHQEGAGVLLGRQDRATLLDRFADVFLDPVDPGDGIDRSRRLLITHARDQLGRARAAVRIERPDLALPAVAEAERLVDLLPRTPSADVDRSTLCCELATVRVQLEPDAPRSSHLERLRSSRKALTSQGLAVAAVRSAVVTALWTELDVSGRDGLSNDALRVLADEAALVTSEWGDASPRDTRAQLDLAGAALVSASALGHLGESAPSVAAALDGQRRIAMLRRRGALIPRNVAGWRDVGWGGATTVVSRWRLAGLRASITNARRTVNATWAHRIELAPVAMGALLMLPIALVGLLAGLSGVPGAEYDLEVPGGASSLVALTLVVLAVAGAFGLVWLTPHRRRTARRQRERSTAGAASLATVDVRIGTAVDLVETSHVLHDVLGAPPDHWQRRLSGRPSTTVRDLDGATAEELARRLVAAGTEAVLTSRDADRAAGRPTG